MSLLLLFRPRGGSTPPPPPPPVETPPGVRRGRKKVVIRLSDVENRKDTADFLKAQLRLLHQDAIPEPHPPAKPILSRADQERDAERAAAVLEAMAIEAAEEERRVIDQYNKDMMAIILLSTL